MEWWSYLSDEIENEPAIANGVTIEGEVDPNAETAIKWLLGKVGGSPSSWKVDANHSNIYIRDSGAQIISKATNPSILFCYKFCYMSYVKRIKYFLF